MAHTPQALVFPPVQRSSAPPARAVDDDRLEHAAQAIRPSWPGAPAPRRSVAAPAHDFRTLDYDARPEENPLGPARRSRRPWLLLVLGLALGGGAWAYMRANAPNPAPAPAPASSAPAARAPAASAPATVPSEQPAQVEPPFAPQPRVAHAAADSDEARKSSAGPAPRAAAAKVATKGSAASVPKSAPSKPAPIAAPLAKHSSKAPLTKQLPKSPPAKPAPAGAPAERTSTAVEPSTRLRVSDFDPPAQPARRAPSAVIRQNPYD